MVVWVRQLSISGGVSEALAWGIGHSREPVAVRRSWLGDQPKVNACWILNEVVWFLLPGSLLARLLTWFLRSFCGGSSMWVLNKTVCVPYWWWRQESPAVDYWYWKPWLFLSTSLLSAYILIVTVLELLNNFFIHPKIFVLQNIRIKKPFKII